MRRRFFHGPTVVRIRTFLWEYVINSQAYVNCPHRTRDTLGAAIFPGGGEIAVKQAICGMSRYPPERLCGAGALARLRYDLSGPHRKRCGGRAWGYRIGPWCVMCGISGHWAN